MTRPQALLLECLSPTGPTVEPLSSLGEHDWQGLFEAATVQQVRPIVLRSLVSADAARLVPPVLWQPFEQACRGIAEKNLRQHAELARLLRVLGAHHIPVVLLKGAHVATALYGNVGLREMGDLDLLLRPEHLADATRLVLESGYTPVRPFTVEHDMSAKPHVTRLVNGSTDIELHWNITDPGTRHTIDPSVLWSRAVPVRILGVDTLGLSTEDLALHLCAHAAYRHHFGFGLRSLRDLAELADRRRDAISWPDVWTRAVAWNWTRGVGLSLALAHDLLAARIPTEFLETIHAPREGDANYEAARLLLMAGWKETRRVPRGVAALGGATGLRATLRHVARSVFLPMDALARDYPHLADRRGRRWRFYLARGRDLLRRHARTVIGLRVRRDPRLVELSLRQNQLRRWLAD